MDIVCHMITSLDGCILLERWSKPAERVDFTQVYEATAKRLQGDGWIVGRITMAEYGQGVVEDKQEQDKVVIENIAQITDTLLTKSLLSL